MQSLCLCLSRAGVIVVTHKTHVFCSGLRWCLSLLPRLGSSHVTGLLSSGLPCMVVVLFIKMALCQVWWYMPVIPALWESGGGLL